VIPNPLFEYASGIIEGADGCIELFQFGIGVTDDVGAWLAVDLAKFLDGRDRLHIEDGWPHGDQDKVRCVDGGFNAFDDGGWRVNDYPIAITDTLLADCANKIALILDRHKIRIRRFTAPLPPQT
jgi:hypothetical protein